MIRSPGNYSDLHTFTQNLQQPISKPRVSDAFLLTGGARAGLEDGAYVQSTNSNNIMHKLLIKERVQAAAN